MYIYSKICFVRLGETSKCLLCVQTQLQLKYYDSSIMKYIGIVFFVCLFFFRYCFFKHLHNTGSDHC